MAEDDGNFYYEQDDWLEGYTSGYTNGWLFAALFLFFIIILFIWAVLAATGDTDNAFFRSNNNNNGNISEFNVVVASKHRNHPNFGKGSDLTFVINGIPGRTLRLSPCKTYKFNVNTPGHPFYFTTNPIGGSNAVDNIGSPGTPIEHGTFTFTVSKDLPQPLYYQCVSHEFMGGRVILNNSDGGMCGSVSVESSCDIKEPISPKRKPKRKGYRKVKDVTASECIFSESD